MTKRTLIAALLAVSLGFTAANAEGMNKCCKSEMQNKSCKKSDKMGKCGGPMPMIMSLDLTKEQRMQMKAIMKKWKGEKAKSMINKGKPMNVAFHDGKFDKELFMSKHAEMAATMAAKKAAVIEEMYSLLTPEQKTALEAKVK